MEGGLPPSLKGRFPQPENNVMHSSYEVSLWEKFNLICTVEIMSSVAQPSLHVKTPVVKNIPDLIG